MVILLKRFNKMEVLKIYILFIGFLFSTFKIYSQNIQLIQYKKSDYNIIIEAGNTDSQIAAIQLQKYLRKSTGVLLPITINENTTKKIIISNNSKYLNKYDKSLYTAIRKDDGFYIKTTGLNVILAGKSGKSLLYAVNEFLQQQVGISFLSHKVINVPEHRSVTLDQINYLYNPVFSVRILHSSEANYTDYTDWHKLQRYRDIPSSEWGGEWGHSFFTLLPPSGFYKTHPEYYSLVNGKRIAEQLCLSNDEVKKLVINDLRAKITQNPNARYWFVSQEDNSSHCMCSQCSKIDAKEGSPSGSLIHFVNKVAEQFPDKKIVTLAYSYTQKAPKHVKPIENVSIMFCTSGNYNRVIPLSEQGLGDLLLPWTRVSNNVIVWDYYVNFKNFLFPLQNFAAMAANLKYYASNNVAGVFMQGNYYGGGAFDELKSYLLAKLSWNPLLNYKDIIKEFCDIYYEEGSKYIQAVLNDIGADMQISKKSIGLFDDQEIYNNSFLSATKLNAYGKRIDQAYSAVKNKTDILQRIRDFEAPFNFIYLKNAITKKEFNTRHFASTQSLLLKKWSYLYDFYKRSGGEFLGETFIKFGDFINDYKKIIDNRYSFFDENNIALNKPIEVKYASSIIHAGDKALVDGIRAFLGIDQNSWVVFTQGIMDVTVDLQKNIKISDVSSVALKVDIVNLEFPDTFEVLYSDDNKTYRKFGKLEVLKIDENHVGKTRLYRVKGASVFCRYIRIIAKTSKVLGVDEIMIK